MKMLEKIYFDNNSTSKVSSQVLQAMVEAYSLPLNSSAVHFFGRAASKALNDSRDKIKDLMGGQNYQVIFTSGGTESNNLALLGFPGYKIVVSAIEHSSVFNLAVKNFASIVRVTEDGILDLGNLEEELQMLPSKNFVVSVMFAHNETGALQPIREIAKLVHRYGGLLHTDMVQAVGKVVINLEELNVDMASISAHKFNGPQGSGALLVRNGLDIEPIILGSSQESGKRAGTQNVAGAVGLGEACKESMNKADDYSSLARLRDYLEDRVREIGGQDVRIFCSQVQRLPNTCYMATVGVDSQTQLIDFDLNGILVSAGSACSSGSIAKPRVLEAMGVDGKIAKTAIRISLGLQNNRDEIDQFIKIWGNLYKKTRG